MHNTKYPDIPHTLHFWIYWKQISLNNISFSLSLQIYADKLILPILQHRKKKPHGSLVNALQTS